MAIECYSIPVWLMESISENDDTICLCIVELPDDGFFKKLALTDPDNNEIRQRLMYMMNKMHGPSVKPSDTIPTNDLIFMMFIMHYSYSARVDIINTLKNDTHLKYVKKNLHDYFESGIIIRKYNFKIFVENNSISNVMTMEVVPFGKENCNSIKWFIAITNPTYDDTT